MLYCFALGNPGLDSPGVGSQSQGDVASHVVGETECSNLSQTTLTAEKVQPEIQDCPANRDSRIQDTHIEWPGGKKFAFTIIDDTDLSTRQNTEPVYDFLAENGFRTTKTVWPLHSVGKKNCGGDTLEDAE